MRRPPTHVLHAAARPGATPEALALTIAVERKPNGRPRSINWRLERESDRASFAFGDLDIGGRRVRYQKRDPDLPGALTREVERLVLAALDAG